MTAKISYGIRRLVLLNTESYSLGDFPLDKPLSISATNNVGKSTAINALQFPFLCNYRDMVFPKDYKQTLKYYFPYENSYVLSEVLTETGTFVVGAAGKGPLSGHEYQLFAIKKELNLEDFLMDATGGAGKKVRTLDQVEQHLGLADHWVKRLKPKQMQDALIGKEITIQGNEKFSIGVFRLKSMTDKNYRLFINVFKNLLHMNDFNMEEVKMFLINSLLPSWESVSYDFMSEYKNFNESLERERDRIAAARSIAKEVQALVRLKADWDEGFEFLSSAFRRIEAGYEREREKKKTDLENMRFAHGEIENQINRIKADNEIQKTAYGRFFSQQEELGKRLAKLERKAAHYALFPGVDVCVQKIALLEDQRDSLVLELGKSTVDPVKRIEQKIKSVQKEIAGFESQLTNIRSNLLFVLKKHFGPEDIQMLMKILNKDILTAFSLENQDLCIHDEPGLVRQLQQLLQRCAKGIYNDGNIRIDLNRVASVDIDDYFNHDRIKQNLALVQKDKAELVKTLDVAKNYQQKEREKKNLDLTIREQSNELEGYKAFLREKQEKPRLEAQLAEAQSELKLVVDRMKDNEDQSALLNKRITGDRFEIEKSQAALLKMEAERQRVLIVKNLEGNTALDREPVLDMDGINIETLINAYVVKREAISDIRARIDQCLVNIELRGGNRFASGRDIPARIKEFEDNTNEESINNYETVLKRNETAATRQLGAMLKNLKDQFHEFVYEIKRFNRDMNKHQISNINKIEFVVDENNNILSIINTLINEDSIFGGDKDIYRVVQRFNELIDKKGVKISLPNLFNLGILVQLENGKEVKSFGSTSIQSTGTDLTVKVVLNVMLLSRILHVKQNQMLNIPAYIDEAGQIDPENQQTLIDQCAKAGFVPIFASVEAQSTAEYWIGLRQVNGKILVEQDDWYRLTAKPLEATTASC
ncbi:conserved hypothetical protein [Desulforapulum autotrophicum HRM2]|uniref:Chromosome segregation ATPase n=1 Tax=Desulforapulum autotrophicum (strain ATCC 43914 / DSM 3382 / VKM B-1955 / HRM2) TaxID=177437 RepID=C0QC53_DESAH|nr:hypothetical protein [Desulforapulum autotrophicum]ACN17070.1 conserved hypothetical protein [Desulforapulum autotrophicum HRM2]